VILARRLPHPSLALFTFMVIVLGSVPPPAPAQPPTAVYRVATLGADQTLTWDAFQRRLRELGYVEGQNIVIEFGLAQSAAQLFFNDEAVRGFDVFEIYSAKSWLKCFYCIYEFIN
jgi:hypothetical protein